MMPNVNYQWIRRFDPVKPLFRGQAYMRAKRVMDLTLLLLSAPLWLPAMLLCALAIFITSPGAPVIYASRRIGRGGKPFMFYKFRTMVPNAKAMEAQLMHLNELPWPDFKITNDPRVTMVGKFLRKTSLDELPQLLNVVKGEMSLVGPRPTIFGTDDYRLWQTERLDFPPGLTGLWQITARGSVNMDERTRMDIAYIERACILLDLYIILRTVRAIVKPSGIT
jgi:lipopolysaccharide/colanic/teichoic acid biosynthesis glycosyltransferase